MRRWWFWGGVAVLLVVVVLAAWPEIDDRREWQADLRRDMGWSGKAPK